MFFLALSSIFAVFIAYPFLGLLLFSVFLFSVNFRLASFFLFLVFSVALTFVNYSKDFAGDYVWYFDHYEYWVDGYFSFPFHNPFHSVYARFSEPVYHTLSFSLAKLFGGNKFIFDLFFTISMYGLVFFAVFNFSKVYGRGGSDLLFYLTICIFVLCINPVMVTHLIRQNLGGGFLLVAFSFLMLGKKGWFYIFSAIAVLTHSSILFPALIMFFSHLFFLKNISYSKVILSIAFSAIAGYFLPFIMTDSGVYSVIGASDGELSLVVYVYDFILLLLAGVVVSLYKDSFNLRVFLITLSFYVFIIFTFSSGLLHLRYYHLFDYFRILLFIILITGFLRLKTRKFAPMVLVVTLSTLGAMNLALRYKQSAFDFEFGLLDVLSYSTFGNVF